MKHRVHLLASTAVSFAAVVASTSAHGQTAPNPNGNGGTGSIITTDQSVASGNANVLKTSDVTIGSADTQTVYSGFNTVGGTGSGGGAGLGGVFFIDTGASLSLHNVSFANNSATGGVGGGVKVDPVAPFAFSIAGTSADASAYVQYNTSVSASNTTGKVLASSLTLAQPNPLIGVGSGVGLILNPNNLYPAYSSSVASTTFNADGTETLNLSTPIELKQNQGFTQATLSSDGKSWSFSSSAPTDIQPGMAVVKSNPGETIPDGLRVDQVIRDDKNNITAITLRNADGSPYQLGNNASVNVINGLTYDISRVASSVNNASQSNTLVSTGPLAGFAVGQTVTGTGVPSGTTVTAVSTSVDNTTGNTITTVTLSKSIDLTTATNIKAAANPVVANSNNAVLNLASTAGLAAGQKISGSGIPDNTTIVSVVGNTVTLSQSLSQGAINTITNSGLLVTVNPIVSTAAGSVTLTSINGYRVGDQITGATIPGDARITAIHQATGSSNYVVEYVIDDSLKTANIGGSLNSLKAPGSVGASGTDGRTGTSYSATFDNGEGAPGSNATSGGTGNNAAGGNGGNGGSGSNGSVTNKTLITTLALDTASLAVDFLNTADDSAGIFTLPHVPGDIAAAVVDAAHVAFDTVQLTAWQLAEKEGLVALGGQGGQGGNGGAGSDFFGGGSGGNGGNGGNGAEPQSPVYSIGGAAGNGGNGGAGGFGAGGGNGGAAGQPGTNGANSGSNGNGAVGSAGFGGGAGSSGGQGGQGGSGFGGAIFVRSGGTLAITGNSVFENNVALAGSSNNGGLSGASAGGDLFMMTGSTVTLTPGTGNTISFYDSIADDSSASISGALAAGQGAQLNIGGGGTVQLFGTDTYTGATNIAGATLEAQDGTGINPYSQIRFSGTGTIGNGLSTATAGVLLSGGTITRAIGIGPTNIDFTGSGGFAGTADNLLLNFGSMSASAGPKLTWGAGGFVPVGSTLVFGSDAVDATGTVTLRNAIDLAGGTGNIAVYHNSGESAAYDAAITGAITNGQLKIGDAGYAGTLLLSGQNALSGITLASGTVSTVNGTQIGRLMDPGTGGFVTVNGGTLQLGGAEKLTTVDVAAGGSLLASGAITAGAIRNAGITGFGATLSASSIANTGVLGLMGTTTVTGSITNAATGTLRQFAATSAGSVANAGTWTLAADLTSPSVANSGRIDVLGNVTGNTETAATRTIHDASFTGTAAGIVNLGGASGTVVNTLVLDQSGNSTYAGTFKGAGSLTKAGAGTLTLTGASSFTGGLNVAAGTLDTTGGGTFADTLGIGVARGATLIVGTADAVGAVTNAGTLTANADYSVASLANSGAARSNGTLLVQGDLGNTGTLTLAGARTQVNGGFANAGTASVAGLVTVAGASTNDGQLTLTPGSAVHLSGSLANTGLLTGGGTLLVDGAVDNRKTGTINLLLAPTQFGSLSNAGALTAAGLFAVTGTVANSGAIALAAPAQFGSFVNSGAVRTADTLMVSGGYEQDAGSLIANGNVTTGSLSGAGGVITLNGSSQLAVNQSVDGSYAGSIGGTGTVAKSGTATLTLAGGQGSITPSALAVLAGGVVVQNAGALGGTLAVTVAAPGTLTLAGDQSIARLGNAGTVLLAANLTATGLVTDDGVLTVVGTAPTTRTIHTAGFGGGATGVVQLGGIDGTAANTLVIDQSGVSSFAGIFTGAGSLTKAGAGTLTLTGANSFTGDLGVTGGTLTLTAANGYTGRTTVANGATLALTGTGSIANAAGVTTDGLFSIAGTNGGASIASLGGAGMVDLGGQRLTLTNAGDTFNGVIAGAGGVTVAGGTETLTGTNTFTGATYVGAPATLVLLGNGSLATASLVDDGVFDISGTTAGASLATLSGAGVVALGAQQLTLTNATDSFAGAINGVGGGVTVAGGTETLTGVNGYTGRTVVGSGATLALAGNGALAASSGIATDGRFDIGATTAGASIMSLSGAGSVGLGAQQLTLTNASETFAGTIDGSGGITVAGGSEQLAGANIFTGRTTVNSGATLGLTGAGSIATSSGVTDNGVFAIDQTANGAGIATLSGNGSVALGAQRLTLTAASDVFGGTIGGTGGLTIAGGTAVLAGANGYTGSTNVATNAQLALAGAGSIGASSTVAVDGLLDLSQASSGSIRSLSGAGVVALGGTTLQLTAAGDTFAGSILGSGGVTVAAGTETLTGGNGYTGQTVVNAGAGLALAGTGTLAGTSGVTANGLFDLRGAAGDVAIRQLDGTGTVVLGAGQLVVAQAGSGFAGAVSGAGGLAITGGTQTLTGTNSYTGGTIVRNATLAIAGDGALGAASAPLALDTATLRFLGSTASARSIGLTGSAVFDTAGNAVALNGTVGGSGMLIAAGGGRLALGGTNSYAGGTQVVGGTTLRIGADAALGATTGVLAIAGGTLQAANDLTTARTILVAQQARFDSDGHVLGVTGTVYGQAGNTYDAIASGGFKLTGILDVVPADAGFTLRSGSLLRGTGTFNRAMLVNGTLAPGNSPGTMTFAAPVTIGAGGTLSLDIDGTGTGTGGGNYSRLVLTGANGVFTAGGTLRPVLRGITGSATNTYSPPVGQAFVVVQTPNAVNGSFARIEQPTTGLLAGTRFDATYGSNVTLYVTPRDYTDLSALGVTLSQNQAAAGAGLNALRGDAGVRTDAATNQVLGTLFALDTAGVARFEDRVAGGIYSDVLRAASARTQSFGRIVDAQSALTTRGHGQLWFTGYGQGYDFGSAREHRTYGYAGGATLQVADEAVLGLAAGHDEGTLTNGARGASADIDLTHITAYGAFTGEHGYARLRAGATRTIVSDVRAIPELDTTAHGHTGGWGFAGAVEVGYVAQAGGWMLTPNLAVRSSQVRLDAFTETGGGLVALAVDKGRFDQVQGIADLRIARDYTFSPGTRLRPQLDFGYVHELGDTVARTDAALAGAPAARLSVDSRANGRDAFRFGAGLTAETVSGVSIFARGDIDTQKNVNSRSGTIGLAYRW